MAQKKSKDLLSSVSSILMNKLIQLTIAFALLFTFSSAHAATAAGAGIKVDGKYIGGYVITQDGETRADLVRQLSRMAITFQREFELQADADNPNSAMLKGKIELVTKIRGDRETMAEITKLKLVKRDGKWYVESKSLKQSLKPVKGN